MKDYSEQELAEINKTIEAMPGICAGGKKGVRMLVEKLVGRQLIKDNSRLRVGQVWRGDMYHILVMGKDERPTHYSIIGTTNDVYKLGHVEAIGEDHTWITKGYTLVGDYNFSSGIPKQ